MSTFPDHQLILWSKIRNKNNIRANELESNDDIEGWKRAADYIRDNMFHSEYRIKRSDLEVINKCLFSSNIIQPRSYEWGQQLSGIVTPKTSGERKVGVMAVNWEQDTAIKLGQYQSPARQYAIRANMGKDVLDTRLIKPILVMEGYATESSTDIEILKLWERYTLSSMTLIGSYIAPSPEDVPSLMDSFINQLHYYQNEIESGNRSSIRTGKQFILGELSRIHPYIKGNGRVARIVTNWFSIYYYDNPIKISNENLSIMIDKAIYTWVNNNIKDILGPKEPSYCIDYSIPNSHHWLSSIDI
jgi:hypothetical protein